MPAFQSQSTARRGSSVIVGRKFSMRSSIKALVLIATGVAVGAVGTALFLRPSIPDRWFTLVQKAPELGAPAGSSVLVDDPVPVSCSDAVIVGSDIVPLSVKSVAGTAKFLSPVSAPIGRCALGYIVKIVTAPLDLSEVPEKYKKERTISVKGGPITVLPIEQATYDVEFIFRFLDRDGFELLSITSREHSVQSGRTSEIQAQTEPTIDGRVASSVTSIAVHVYVKKCVTATDE